MLLVIDVGNTETALGLYDGDDLAHTWRVKSDGRRTADEFAITLDSLLRLRGLSFDGVGDIVLASVVPAITQNLEAACARHLGKAPLVIGPGVKTGMPIANENPREVGADRIVNAVAAFEDFGEAVVIVDFGTATTLDYVNDKGEYRGGIIAPGLQVAGDSLFSRTAKLPRVEIARPPSVIGRNTVHGIQSGLFYGYAALVDGLVDRIAGELGKTPRVVATGGLAPLIAGETRSIEKVDEYLTLRGLRLIFQRNPQE